MARYKYLPIRYNDYLSKYINSLKTGELLVDLVDHDIYVTEEGMNLPVPTTKALKEAIIRFLETDLAGIKLRTKELPFKVNNLYSIYDQITEQQFVATNKVHNLEAKFPNPRSIVTTINSINESNINHLGDLEIDLSTIADNTYKTRIQALADRFNELNNSSQSVLFDSTSTMYNKDLLFIWNDLRRLMAEAHAKLDGLGSFRGNFEVNSTQTYRTSAHDVQYSRRLWNWSLGFGINTEAQYIARCKQLETNFGKWWRDDIPDDVIHSKMNQTGRGNGVFYKNFPNKYNHRTKNYNATNYDAWNVMEGFPDSTYPGFGYNIKYIFSFTNHQFIDYNATGKYASEANWTLRFPAPNTSPGVRWSNGGQTWQRGYRQSFTEATTTNKLLDLISYVDPKRPNQRMPHTNIYNTRGGLGYSNQIPTIPVISRLVKFISHTNRRNSDGIIIRLGMIKDIDMTKISYTKVGFDPITGWGI